MTLAEAIRTIKLFCSMTDCESDKCPYSAEDFESDGVPCSLMRSTPNLWTIPTETNLYDVEEIHENCTVQILRNSLTGEESVGWWENEVEKIG